MAFIFCTGVFYNEGGNMKNDKPLSKIPTYYWVCVGIMFMLSMFCFFMAWWES